MKPSGHENADHLACGLMRVMEGVVCKPWGKKIEGQGRVIVAVEHDEDE